MYFLTVRFVAESKRYLAVPLLEVQLVVGSTPVDVLPAFRPKSILQLALVDL